MMEGPLRAGRLVKIAQIIAAVFFVAYDAGCSHGAGFSQPSPISVSLAVSTITVSQNGTPIVVPISIVSTSETATVGVVNLPMGVQEAYSSSDTNPSGTLRFTANSSTPLGTYIPYIMVVSAGQTASTMFKLVVTAR